MKPVKLIISHKENLQWKYENNFSKIIALLKKMQSVDAKKGLDTKIIFADDVASLKNSHVKKISSWSEEECKRIVDDLYNKYVPAYIVILGAQDIFPFQEIENPAEDIDTVVPSDLPYACDAPFSRKIENFTGPTRVVGRIPDIPGRQNNIRYLKELIENSIAYKPVNADNYRNYFSISAWVWRKSTEISLQRMFGDNKKMSTSPGIKNAVAYHPFTKNQLQPMTHFYNCHGADLSLSYYGQRGSKNFPEALQSINLLSNISRGTIVASECCYGAQLFDPVESQLNQQSIANSYLGNNAIAFLGSSTIAYGPSDSQGLADLITQFFIKNILKGASTGRAFLEARQKFLSDNGPDLDPYELKTIAQFYLLGDPSVQPALCDEAEIRTLSEGSAIANTRKNLSIKGQSLKETISVSKKQDSKSDIKTKMTLGNNKVISINKILEKNNFLKEDKTAVFNVKPKASGSIMLQKKLGGKNVKFHTYIQHSPHKKIHKTRVLVVKENSEQILAWRYYESK